MSLKFNLNKRLKIDNIENYYLKNLIELQDIYTEFLEASDGVDPDYPMFNFGGKKGKKIKGVNAAAHDEEIENEKSRGYGD